MTEEQIEGNKIIAEFDGRKFKAYNGNTSYDKEFDTYKECEDWIGGLKKSEGYKPEIGWKLDCGKYHSSWNWLMPVVEKIEQLSKGNSVYINTSQFELYDAPFTECTIWVRDEPSGGISGLSKWHTTNEDRSKIKSVWLSVIKFIKWYNNQNKQQ